ncbi:MAG: ATPase, T2SS/T4P/T4SS family [bacterium]|nr:ATPase, T2SS/T4P/T4SS family [bacterium]
MFEQLGAILVREKLLSQDQLGKALAEQRNSRGKKIGEVLVHLGLVVEENITRGLAIQSGHDYYSADRLLEAKDAALQLVPEDFAKEHLVLPIKAENNTIVVAMADPDDISAEDGLRKLTGLRIVAVMSSETAIKAAVEQLYVRIRKQGEVKDTIGELQFFAEADSDDESLVDMTKAQSGEEDAPIVKLVNLIVAEALKERATDIHIEVQGERVAVRYRVDGVLLEVMSPPKASHPGIISRIKILSKLNIAERRLPQDGRFSIRSTEKEVDVRVSILPTVNGEKIVLRLLDKSSFSMDLTSLGFEEDQLKVFRRTIKQPYGMVIVSGPTGSGKSTTLYASLKDILSPDDNITTVEDPVEYQLSGINQVQIKEKIGLTFAATLRSILRQDPDKLLIGEIRDEETADIAVKFSLTGHIVFSTLHANDAPATITRLIDIGIPPFLVGSSLLLVMAQRLVRKICSHCKHDYTPDPYELEMLNITEEERKYTGSKFYRGTGCVHCRNTGYYGRVGIFELLRVTPRIRQMIFDNMNQEIIRQEALKEGLVSLRQSGIRKISQGVTTIHELLRVTSQEEH